MKGLASLVVITTVLSACTIQVVASPTTTIPFTTTTKMVDELTLHVQPAPPVTTTTTRRDEVVLSDEANDRVFIKVLREQSDLLGYITFVDTNSDEWLIGAAQAFCDDLDAGNTFIEVSRAFGEAANQTGVWSQDQGDAALLLSTISVPAYCDQHMDALNELLGR